MTGKIKFFNKEKAFGFIQIEESPKEIFFHISGFGNKPIPELTKGGKVEFEIGQGNKGDLATNIELIQND